MDAKPERHGQPKSGRGIFFEFLRQIHQIEPVGRTCKGGVKPVSYTHLARLACRQLGVKDADFYQALSEYSVSLQP